MTVSAQTPINRSAGNGVTTVFPYTFKIIAAGDIEVTVDDVVKTLNVDYTVTGAGVDAGGNVTMTTAPASGTTVVRRRNMAIVRTTDYQDQGALPAATLDSDIDATVLMAQQLDERLDRTFSLPASSSANSTMPAPTAGYVIGWDALGESLTNLPAAVGTSLIDLAASGGSALVVYLPAGIGAVATTVQAKLRESVSVLDFGASSGASAAANLTAFKASVAALATGGRLIIPVQSSFYSIDTSGGLSTAIEINKRMEVVFEGDVKATFGTMQANPPYIFKVTADGVTFSGSSSLIGEGTIDDTNAGTDDTIPGLVYVSGDNFTMTGVTVDTPPKTGVMLYNCSNANISGSKFTGGPTSYTTGNTGYFAVRAYQGGNHIIANNRFVPNDAGGMYVNTIFTSGSNNCVITGNTCIKPYEKFVYLSSNGNVVQGNTVLGNTGVIPGLATKGTVTSVLRFDGHNNVVTGNFVDYTAGAVTCRNSYGNNISNNVFLRSGQGAIAVFTETPYVGGLSNTIISGNFCTFDFAMGIAAAFGGIFVNEEMAASINISINNNIVDGFSNASGGAIYVKCNVAGYITKLKINDNVASGAVNGVFVQNVTRSVVSGNTLDVSGAMLIQSLSCSDNSFLNNYSPAAGSRVSGELPLVTTYHGNQWSLAPIVGSVTFGVGGADVLMRAGGITGETKCVFFPLNDAASTLVATVGTPRLWFSGGSYFCHLASGAAVGGEIFGYQLIH